MIVFGPIPSRRLGKSVGINNIPPKICSYSCIYCQAGKATQMLSSRKEYYPPEEIYKKVKAKIKQLSKKEEHFDYLSFVPDGEPTLDINLGKSIELLQPLGFKIAVITNSSLLINENVRHELAKADLVSVKIDAHNVEIWKQINHPHKSVHLNAIIEGLYMFREIYKNKLITETMLVKGVNDHPEHISHLAELIGNINPETAYLSIPTRPPLKKTVEPPDEATITACYEIFNQEIHHVECLTGYEGNEFICTGNIGNDLLSIASVHPLREDAIDEILRKENKSWNIIDRLISEDKLVKIKYQNNNYFIRKV